jgi:hypothetical protein
VYMRSSRESIRSSRVWVKSRKNYGLDLAKHGYDLPERLKGKRCCSPGFNPTISSEKVESERAADQACVE